MNPATPPVVPPTTFRDLRFPPTPFFVRVLLGLIVVALGGTAYYAHDTLGTRGQAALGVVAFFLLAATFSSNLRAVNWRTIGWGIALQLVLALLVLRVPAVYQGFEYVGDVVKRFIGFSNEGSKFVFGN